MSLSNLRIEIGGTDSAPYKSLEYVLWEQIPSFVVLTGLNGSGKTQLLEFLAYRITGTWHPQSANLDRVHLSLEGEDFDPGEVVYIPSRWSVGCPSSNLSNLQSIKRKYSSQYKQDNVQADLAWRSKRAHLSNIVGGSLQKLEEEVIAERLPNDFRFVLSWQDLSDGLAHVFLAYRFRLVEELEGGVALSEITERIGPAPWDIVNALFEEGGFNYRIVSPQTVGLLDTYQIFLEEPQTGLRIQPVHLF